MRMLYEEQVRLRAELAKLQEKGGEGSDKESKKDDDKKDDKKDEKKKEEKKPPLKQRIQDWVKKHPVATILIVIAFILFLIGVFWLIHYLDSYTDTDDAFVDGHTDPISTRISGMVAAVYVENTWRVRKGQLLLELDPRDNQVAKEQAAANYAQATAGTRAQAPNVPITATDQSTQVINTDFQVVNAGAQVAAADKRYNAALADLSQAEAQHANAQREEERYRQLVDKEEVSREQYDQRATDERTQAAVVVSRKEQANAAGRTVEQAKAQLGQAEQQHEQARRNLPQQVVPVADGTLPAYGPCTVTELSITFTLLAAVPSVVLCVSTTGTCCVGKPESGTVVADDGPVTVAEGD